MLSPFIFPKLFFLSLLPIFPINQKCSIQLVRKVFFKSNKMTSFSADYSQRKTPSLTHPLEFLLLFHLFGNLNPELQNTHSLKTQFLLSHLHLLTISTVQTKRMRKKSPNRPNSFRHFFKN